MVVGVGLIGGSVGMALRQAGWHVVGVDHDPERIAAAVEAGAIDAGGELGECDLAFIATPVNVVGELARSALAAGAAVVTDVGSVKGPIAGLVDDPRFVPGHPMAGSEQDGLDGAFADMFSGAMWVLCPTETTDDAAFAEVRGVVSSFGAQVIVMPARPSRHARRRGLPRPAPHGRDPDEAGRRSGRGAPFAAPARRRRVSRHDEDRRGSSGDLARHLCAEPGRDHRRAR